MFENTTKRYKACQIVSRFLQKTAPRSRKAPSHSAKQKDPTESATRGVRSPLSNVIAVTFIVYMVAYTLDDAICGHHYQECISSHTLQAVYYITHSSIYLSCMVLTLFHVIFNNNNGIINKGLTIVLFAGMLQNILMAFDVLMSLPISGLINGIDYHMYTVWEFGPYYFSFVILGVACLRRSWW